MLLQFTAQLLWPPGWPVPWGEHSWQKAVSLPRLISVHSSCLHSIWFSLHKQPHPHQFLPSDTAFLKAAPHKKFTSHYYFLVFTATVTSSHHTICSSSLSCWAVCGLWNLTAEVTSPSCPQPCLSRSQGLQLAHSALPRNTPANKGKSTSSFHPLSALSPDGVGFLGHRGLLLFGYRLFKQFLSSGWSHWVLHNTESCPPYYYRLSISKASLSHFSHQHHRRASGSGVNSQRDSQGTRSESHP